ncbi:MAG: indole-3-glycerol phosphate synthase TrpC [Candidatus Altiarchaeota archaeon]|nr:indole-3-glycerol phosphate synthase TrpC [Candidatus Altiarchaeota archaeon]
MRFDFGTITGEKLDEIKAIKEKRSLITAIEDARDGGVNPVIAEVKRKSPTLGDIRDVDPVKTAREMEEGGACAISVLTDKHFDGGLYDLMRVKEAMKVPVLRKDFIVDEFQIYQSYGAGADVVLLIVSLLKEKTKGFVELIHGLGMEALVEVHCVDELGFALDSDAKLIGVNNRDLGTLEIKLGTTKSLAGKIPGDRVIVSESGVNTTEDLAYVLEAGAKAALIGTSIMQAESIKEKVREFVER